MREKMEMERIRAPWQIADCAKETPVLLALSGGADSRFLLHVLAQYAKRDGFSLTLAHVNHGIRGEAAVRDREFCIALADEYGLEIEVLNADVPSLAKERRRGLEETAREIRYRFFEELNDFEDALVKLYEDEILPHVEKGLSATVLTQVSDVEDETNGLLTYDRAVMKVDPRRMKKLSRKLYESFESKWR